MIEYEIIPHVGVGPVRLGMCRSDVHRLLGEPNWTNKNREEFIDGFFVNFDDTGCVEFIELAKSQVFRTVFDGMNLHDLPADEALALIGRHGRYDNNDPELGYSYVFSSLQLSLWRGTLPEPDQGPDNPDGRYFEAIGVGVVGYFVPRKSCRLNLCGPVSSHTLDVRGTVV